MSFLKRVIIVFMALSVFGCAGWGAKSAVEAPELTYKKKAYVIGISDQLHIDVWRNADLTRSVSVRPDGFITMPLMGDIRAEGRTPEQLAEVISDGLKTVIKSPDVTVTITNPVSVAYQYRVRVLGQVNQPVSVAFVEGMTVMDLVLAAGGVGPYGAPDRASLSRLTDSGYKNYKVKLAEILNEGKIETNYLLQPSDVLTVPEKSIWKGEF
jgi:polysaccharide export outer membrane protein